MPECVTGLCRVLLDQAVIAVGATALARQKTRGVPVGRGGGGGRGGVG